MDTAGADGKGVDAVIYPALLSTISLNDGGGNKNAFGRRDTPSAANGIPTIVVPVGYNHQGQPINVQFLGRAWDDDKLVGYAYALEQVANAAGRVTSQRRRCRRCRTTSATAISSRTEELAPRHDHHVRDKRTRRFASAARAGNRPLVVELHQRVTGFPHRTAADARSAQGTASAGLGAYQFHYYDHFAPENPFHGPLSRSWGWTPRASSAKYRYKTRLIALIGTSPQRRLVDTQACSFGLAAHATRFRVCDGVRRVS
jgi:hypothetical protein